MEWNDLHIRLADILGDPFQSDGSPVSFNTDGIRYTVDYRNRLLNDPLRWVLMNFDPVYLYQNGIPGGLIHTENNTTETTKNIMRLLSVELAADYIIVTTPSVDDEPTVETVPQNIPVPIVTRTTRRNFRLLHPHWTTTPYAVLTGRNTVSIFNSVAEYHPVITYVEDFDDISDESLEEEE